jgi:hypothetical protein
MNPVIIGESIGSVQIDNDFEELVRQRLSKVDFRRGKINTGPLADAAHIMATGGFQDIKHKLGQPVAELEFYPINVPGLTLDFNDKGAGIEGGAMKFTP